MVASDTNNPIKREDRKESLLAYAGDVFAAKGFAATKISDIATAAGVSQGLLYRYFPSKDALFSELIRSSFEKINQAAKGLEEMPIPAREKIVKALTAIIASMTADDDFPNRVLLIAQASLSDGIPEQVKNILRSESGKPYEAVARIMAEGQKDGSILPGDPMELATLFWTTVKGLALHRVAKGKDFKAPSLDLILRIFVTEKKLT